MRIIADYQCKTGEGPLWHPDEKKLYWADIPTGRMFRYDPAKDTHEQFYEGEVVGGYTIQQDGSLLLFMAKGSVATWNNGKLDYVIEKLPGEENSRFNDVIADPAGRVFCGTMSTPESDGTLYLLHTNGDIEVVLEGVGTPNGMGFTLDKKEFYFTDSRERTIYKFDYDQATGKVTNQREFIKTPEGEGVPDGMTVDAEGYIWSARWDGGGVYRYTPEGVFERKVEIEAKKASSLTFAGEDLTDIYITSAGGHKKEQEGKGAGALFHVNLGIKGVAENRSNVK